VVNTAKIDIKLKDNFISIIAYRARQKIAKTWQYIGKWVPPELRACLFLLLSWLFQLKS
jgi:hypothetical protein